LAGKRRPASKSAPDCSPHQAAARPSNLLKILGQELREHYELPHNLPHGMFTLLMELSNRGGSPALRPQATIGHAHFFVGPSFAVVGWAIVIAAYRIAIA
jgi:hypothetical protein